MSDKPFFSILIPTYNQAQYLGEALDSIIAQTDADWEAIIINDGSTDNTAQIIEEYCRKESRFIAIHKTNGGTGSALNIGLTQAKGQWICWLSSDDVFEVNKLEIHRQWINKDPESKFFFSDFQQLLGTTGKITNFNPTLRNDIPPVKFQVIGLIQGNFIAGNSICISREAWLSVGYFNEELRYAQDYDMWLRLALKYPATFISEYTYLQRVYPEQESQRFSEFCLYDSARAITNMLNSHSLQEIFPLISLNDRTNINQAIKNLINLAFDYRNQMYQLGFQPLLIIKIKNFLDNHFYHDQDLHLLLAKSLQEKAKSLKGSLVGIWCDFCHKLYYDINNNFGNKSKYDQNFNISIKYVILSYYLWLHNIDINKHLNGTQAIQKYLDKFYDINVDEINTDTSSYIQILDKVVFSISEPQQAIFLSIFNNKDIEKIIRLSFFEGIQLLEKLDYSLENIHLLIAKHYGFPISKLIALWINTQRAFKLISQGIFWTRLRDYYRYIQAKKTNIY